MLSSACCSSFDKFSIEPYPLFVLTNKYSIIVYIEHIYFINIYFLSGQRVGVLSITFPRMELKKAKCLHITGDQGSEG